MVRLTVETESGQTVVGDFALRDLPITLGRNPNADLRLDGPGVWDWHAELVYERKGGCRIRPAGPALVVVNGEAVTESRLRNFDRVDLGSIRLRFGFTETQQRRFSFRERATWTAIFLLCVGQLLLVYWVLP